MVSGLEEIVILVSKFNGINTIFFPEHRNTFLIDGELAGLLCDFVGLIIVERVWIFVPCAGLHRKNMAIHKSDNNYIIPSQFLKSVYCHPIYHFRSQFASGIFDYN